MKKILLIILLVPILIVSFLIFKRYESNKTTIIPYPFRFESRPIQNLEEAPIVIIGDSMAKRLSTFKDLLSQKLSENLSKPIKIVSYAKSGENIHRTVRKLRSLPKPPLIIIYIGHMDQADEFLFRTKDLNKINKNFKLYQDDRVRSALMIYPQISRFIYTPIDEIILKPSIVKDEKNYQDIAFQKRTALHYTLYQAGLKELFNYAQKRNSLIIPLTTPINLKLAPKKVCYGAATGDASEQIQQLLELIENEDFKNAFNLGKELVLTNPYHSKINYLYSRVLFKLNKYDEALKYGEFAKVYDCANYGANPVYNSILRSVATEARYEFLDFHKFLADESSSNFVFIEEIYPQDVYLKKIIDALARKIKKRLRL